MADGEIRLRGEQGANKGAVSPGKSWACWRDRMKKQGFAGSKAPTRAPSAGEKAARVGVGGRRNKASPGARRQQRRRQPGKILDMLALADGETGRCREQSANKGAVSPGKTWACWRWLTEKKSFPRSEAPTKAPSAWENPRHVGVGRRRNKASRGARRQQRRHQPGKNRPVLACPDEETRLREERGANIGAVSLGKTGPCWRARMKKQGSARSEAPT